MKNSNYFMRKMHGQITVKFRLCVFHEMVTVCTTRCKNMKLAMENRVLVLFLLFFIAAFDSN